MTRKITQTVARIFQGLEKTLYIGNMDAKRDWGYAPDFVEAMWRMLQQEQAEDFVIATGELHSVREFIERAFEVVNIEIDWQGSGVDEQGINRATGDVVVQVNPKYYRPIDIDLVLGDASKAWKKLGWKSAVKFDQLVKIMMEADLEMVAQEG